MSVKVSESALAVENSLSGYNELELCNTSFEFAAEYLKTCVATFQLNITHISIFSALRVFP